MMRIVLALILLALPFVVVLSAPAGIVAAAGGVEPTTITRNTGGSVRMALVRFADGAQVVWAGGRDCVHVSTPEYALWDNERDGTGWLDVAPPVTTKLALQCDNGYAAVTYTPGVP